MADWIIPVFLVFFLAQYLVETFLTVLGEMEVHEASIASELRRALPFLATTTLLMAAVKAGGGREQMHETIRGHALEVARGLREGALSENDLPARLGQDAAFPLSTEEVKALLADPLQFMGAAPEQVDAFAARVAEVTSRFPNAASYRPEPIL